MRIVSTGLCVVVKPLALEMMSAGSDPERRK